MQQIQGFVDLRAVIYPERPEVGALDPDTRLPADFNRLIDGLEKSVAVTP